MPENYVGRVYVEPVRRMKKWIMIEWIGASRSEVLQVVAQMRQLFEGYRRE